MAKIAQKAKAAICDLLADMSKADNKLRSRAWYARRDYLNNLLDYLDNRWLIDKARSKG